MSEWSCGVCAPYHLVHEKQCIRWRKEVKMAINMQCDAEGLLCAESKLAGRKDRKRQIERARELISWWRGWWSWGGASRSCGSAAAACGTASAAATMRPAPAATPWTGAGSLSPKARRAPSARSSARPAAATAVSTAGCRCTRLHGIARPTRRRRAATREALLQRQHAAVHRHFSFVSSIIKLQLLLAVNHV